MKKIASRKDPRIIDLLIAHGAAGYGIYVMLVEYLGERKSFRSMKEVRRIAYELHADAETVRSIIQDFDLFDVDTEENISRKGELRKTKVEKPVEKVENVTPAPPAPPVVARIMTRSERRRQERLRQKNSA